MRKEDQEISIKILLVQSQGSVNSGRPRRRWRNEVEEYARMCGMGNRWMMACDRVE